MYELYRINKRYIIYAFLFVFLGIYSLDRLTVSIAGSTISKEMNLGPVGLGYLFSSYLWLYAVCLLPAGAWTDRMGTRRMAAIAAGLWSLFQTLGGFATSAAMLLLTRLGNGAFEAAANPCAHATIREWTPRRERGIATAIWFSGAHAVPGLGAPILAWIVSAYGWRMSFIATGVLGFLWVLGWVLLYRRPEEARWLAPEERDMIVQERDFDPPAVAGPGLGYKGLFASSTMWGLFVTQACVNYTAYFYLAWLPTFLQADFGLTVVQSGAYTAIPYFVSAVMCLVLSYVADRFLSADAVRAGKRRIAVALANIASASVILVPLAGSVNVAMVILTIAFCGNSFAQTMNFALVNDRLRSSGDTGRAYAIFTLGGIGFGMLSPIITGYMVDFTGTYNSALVLIGLIALLGTVFVLFLTKYPIGDDGEPEEVEEAAALSPSR
ncbi:MAG: MFS transporter [Rhizobiaceae bacterium]|nr:MFS transporter [Rhizobiaceae bacterium]